MLLIYLKIIKCFLFVQSLNDAFHIFAFWFVYTFPSSCVICLVALFSSEEAFMTKFKRFDILSHRPQKPQRYTHTHLSLFYSHWSLSRNESRLFVCLHCFTRYMTQVTHMFNKWHNCQCVLLLLCCIVLVVMKFNLKPKSMRWINNSKKIAANSCFPPINIAYLLEFIMYFSHSACHQ